MSRSFFVRVVPLALVLAVAVSACGRALQVPAGGPGGVEPAAAVDRFLQLSAVPDYLEMGWYFGTDKGPVVRRDPPADVERRMYAIASILNHERYVIRPATPVPGRVGNALRLDVALTQRGREVVVPFTVVRGPGQRWFIEQIQLEALTGR